MRVMGSGYLRFVLICVLLFAAPLVARSAEGESEAAKPRPVLRETVEVTADRLPPPTPLERVPAHVTVIDRQAILDSAALTLQELLAGQPGVIVYDQVGNDVERTLDLRGFTGGNATKVYLDGAPVNDTRNNALALQLIPLEALERVEITRGSAANSAGGGAEAGAIHLWTLRPESFGGRLLAAGGSDGARRLRGTLGDAAGRVDWRLSATDETTDGFRENADGDLTRVAGTAGFDLGGDRRIEIDLVDGRSHYGNPGALTREELEADRGAAPFNRLDFADERLGQAALSFRGPLTSSLSISANLFGRDRASEILSTGRSAATFGGFFLDSDGSTFGSTVQLTHARRVGASSNDFSAGIEWLDGDTDSHGFFTPPGDPGSVDFAAPDSMNTTERRVLGLFIQDSWRPIERLSLMLGLRYDRDRLGYVETVPDPTLRDAKTFDELSLRAGATWNAGERHGVWLSYGESFLPPTVEQLFAFPLFGSNPELEPQDSRTWELGWRGRFAGRLAIDTALFVVETRDEILFVVGPPPTFIGTNENAGRTRREGLELGVRGALTRSLDLSAALTLIDAEFTEGADDGNDVPLVPGERVTLGMVWRPSARWSLRVEGTHVGEQVLGNDAANAVEKLEAYSVVDARVTFAARGRMVGADSLLVFVDARNLFDREYVTRGIHAFDFSTSQNASFFTPAPDRRWLAGVEWRF